MRTFSIVALSLTLLSGACFSVNPTNGTLKCDPSNAAKPCPPGYHCAMDGTCWQRGQDPMSVDLGVDLANGPDFAIVPDLAILLDFAIPDGNHLGHVTAAAGGAVGISGTGTHRATLSIGQPLVGNASSAGNHAIQFGILRGTVSK